MQSMTSNYPVEFDIEYPDRPLDRLSTAFRLIFAIPILVLLVPFAYLLSTGAVDWGPARKVLVQVYGRVLHASGTPGRDGLPTTASAPADEEAA